MRPVINNQELDEKKAKEKHETQQEPETEKWARSNLSWLSQTEYQRYLYLLEEETAAIDQEKVQHQNQ